METVTPDWLASLGWRQHACQEFTEMSLELRDGFVVCVYFNRKHPARWLMGTYIDLNPMPSLTTKTQVRKFLEIFGNNNS